MHQWQAIAIAACEQSGRNKVPVVHQPVNLEHYLQALEIAFKICFNPNGAKSWRDYDLKHSVIALLIGPEGGLSDEEIKQAGDYSFQSLSLGPRILRTETAAITALSVLQAVGGDL